MINELDIIQEKDKRLPRRAAGTVGSLSSSHKSLFTIYHCNKILQLRRPSRIRQLIAHKPVNENDFEAFCFNI